MGDSVRHDGDDHTAKGRGRTEAKGDEHEEEQHRKNLQKEEESIALNRTKISTSNSCKTKSHVCVRSKEMERINPLVTDPLYLVCMTKFSILKNEGIIENISYERRAYESVYDRSQS